MYQERLTPEAEAIARRIADEIKACRNGLAAEEKNLTDHPTYVRAKKYRDQDRATINGMRIALTFALGRPNDMQLAEEFIKDSDIWRALL